MARGKERLLAERGIEDPDSSPVPELVEALVRLDRAQDAAERLEPFANAAEAKGQPWSLARLARCRGLLAETTRSYAEALELHAAHARTASRRRARSSATARRCGARASA